MKSLIVSGPQGVGKTRHAETIRKKKGLKYVLEYDQIPLNNTFPIEDNLILSNLSYAQMVSQHPEIDEGLVKFTSFFEIKKELNLK